MSVNTTKWFVFILNRFIGLNSHFHGLILLTANCGFCQHQIRSVAEKATYEVKCLVCKLLLHDINLQRNRILKESPCKQMDQKAMSLFMSMATVHVTSNA